MNIKIVKSLVSIMEKSNLSLLEIAEGDVKIRLEKAAPAPVCAEPKPLPAAPAKTAAQPEETVTTVDFNNITEVKSPMVGVFYAAPSPDAAPFVQKGSRVRSGDVLCIVEAMKLMNEINAETDGEIVDICVKNGDIVEYGQTLFKIF